MNLWVIVGHSRCRKSSTVRALTGAGKTPIIYDIAFPNGETLPTLVIISALQECCIPPELLVAIVNGTYIGTEQKYLKLQELIRNNLPVLNNILIVLREDAIRGKRSAKEPIYRPSADRYIEHFHQAGWNIRHPIISFNEGYISPCDIAVQHIPSTEQPTNQTARAIRQYWNWL